MTLMRGSVCQVLERYSFKCMDRYVIHLFGRIADTEESISSLRLPVHRLGPTTRASTPSWQATSGATCEQREGQLLISTRVFLPVEAIYDGTQRNALKLSKCSTRQFFLNGREGQMTIKVHCCPSSKETFLILRRVILLVGYQPLC